MKSLLTDIQESALVTKKDIGDYNYQSIITAYDDSTV